MDPSKHLTMADSIEHYHAVNEAVHRHWNYLIFAGGGFVVAATFSPAAGQLAPYTSLVFLVFALVNLKILFESQKELCIILGVIRRMVGSDDDGNTSEIVNAMKPYSAKKAMIGHLLIDIAVILLLLFVKSRGQVA